MAKKDCNPSQEVKATPIMFGGAWNITDTLNCHFEVWQCSHSLRVSKNLKCDYVSFILGAMRMIVLYLDDIVFLYIDLQWCGAWRVPFYNVPYINISSNSFPSFVYQAHINTHAFSLPYFNIQRWKTLRSDASNIWNTLSTCQYSKTFGN